METSQRQLGPDIQNGGCAQSVLAGTIAVCASGPLRETAGTWCDCNCAVMEATCRILNLWTSDYYNIKLRLELTFLQWHDAKTKYLKGELTKA